VADLWKLFVITVLMAVWRSALEMLRRWASQVQQTDEPVPVADPVNCFPRTAAISTADENSVGVWRERVLIVAWPCIKASELYVALPASHGTYRLRS
jgi:hypothetical protein